MPRFLMCPPEFFGVEYVINPWMQGKLGTVVFDCATRQWEALHALLTDRLGAVVEIVPAQDKLPDMVFTANAGLVRGTTCIPSRFRYAERQGEEPYFIGWFREHGWNVHALSQSLSFEGAGDALFDGGEEAVLWAGYGFRTDQAAHALLADTFAVEVVSLGLVDGRYYHLDTCFCPLPGGYLLWYPPAFDPVSQALVEARVAPGKRFAVGDADARHFACNAVAVNDAVVLNGGSDELFAWLRERGFTPYPTPLTEFLKAGGAAKCLTLRLD